MTTRKRHTRKGEAVRVFKDGYSQRVYVSDVPQGLSIRTLGETNSKTRIMRVRDYLIRGINNAKTDFGFRWYWNGLDLLERTSL